MSPSCTLQIKIKKKKIDGRTMPKDQLSRLTTLYFWEKSFKKFANRKKASLLTGNFTKHTFKY
jgi:hypothetical protein